MATGTAPGGRTPEDEPFVVRASRGKRLAWIVLVAAATAAVAGGALAGLAAIPMDIALGLLLCLLVGALAIVLPLLALLRLHPVLAIGPDGVWIATGSALRRPVRLPWAAVEQISLRRRLAPVLAVRSRALPDRRGRCEVALWGVDRRPAEIEAALARYRPAGPPP